jgi:HlyD family type I secretion membrane fusion protein
VSAAIALATVIEYNVMVKVPATVRPSGETGVVQAAIEGTVERIFVEENQGVEQGEAIAKLDDSRLQTQKNQLTDNIQQNQRQFDQITAQIAELDTQIAAESQLLDRTIASDQAELRRNQRDYQDRQVTTRADVQEAEAALELARQEWDRYQQLANTGAVSQLQIEEKEEAFKIARARLERARAGLNPSADNVAIAEERIAQDQARGASTLATLNQKRKEIIQQKIELQNRINHDRQELKQIETELDKSVIRAPEAGTILQLNLRNPQQVVSPGDVIAQLAPSDAPLVIKARVPAQDISKVSVCQPERIADCPEGKVQLRVSAYPYPDYGVLKGAVRAIAADVTTPQTPDAAATAPYYEVTIQPEQPYFVKGDRTYPIQAGMEVTADIIATEETLLTFILRKARLITDL